MQVEEIFKVGDKIEVIYDQPLTGNENGPKIKNGDQHFIESIVLDSKGNQHLDIGLPSQFNYIRSWDTKEELPSGDSIQWCHPSRFKKV